MESASRRGDGGRRRPGEGRRQPLERRRRQPLVAAAAALGPPFKLGDGAGMEEVLLS